MSKTKYQTSQADMKRITSDCIERIVKEPSLERSFSVLETLFRSRDYAANYPASLLSDLFAHWRNEQKHHLLYMASVALVRELEEKRKAQRDMKECFRSLLNLD